MTTSFLKVLSIPVLLVMLSLLGCSQKDSDLSAEFQNLPSVSSTEARM